MGLDNPLLIIGISILFLIANGKRMSNGPMESLNGRIKHLLHDGYGYSNFDSFRKRILFILNKIEPVIFQK